MNEEWQKSSLSTYNGNCGEVTLASDGQILMRNSRFPDGAQLSFTVPEWNAFIGGAKLGEFDLDEDGQLPEMPPLLRSGIA